VTLRIAVLSDQHIHRAAQPASWELAQRAFRIAARYDHIVLAGDTFDSATAFENDHERVRDHLVKRGLWHRDRMTVVPGNHDFFHTPHRGTKASKAAEFGRKALSPTRRALVREPIIERAFDAWAGALTTPADRLHTRRPFPMRKMLGHVALYAADTAPRRLLSCANGFWRSEADALLRAATPEAEERRVLAIHHPPKETRMVGAEHALRSLQKWRVITPFGFPPKNFARLAQFAEEAQLDAVVCGHIHAAKAYQWEVAHTTVPAFMVGRSGGLNKRSPIVGVLTVPVRGAVSWREVPIG
jgi:predicted phosphodiesterase